MELEESRDRMQKKQPGEFVDEVSEPRGSTQMNGNG